MGEIQTRVPADVLLLQKALSLEMEKRSAILSADGRELQRKTRESEEVLRKMAVRASAAEPLSPEARGLAEKLKAESDENHRLLENSTRTIHRLLSDLGEKETTYNPGSRKAPQTGGMLVDASV